MRIQEHANSSARSFDLSTPDALASANDLPAADGWPMSLESLKRKASQRKPVSGHASKHKAGENAMAEIQEAEAVYDAFVVAKYLADPLHGTVDNTAELIAEMSNAGEPEHSPEADQPAHSHEHTPIDHTPVSADHQTQHGIGAEHSLDPHPVEPAAQESLLHTLAEEGRRKALPIWQ